MLETIREYGLEKLEEAGELDAIRAAHARYFADLVAEAEPQAARCRAASLVRAAGRRARAHASPRCATSARSRDAREALRLAVDLLWVWLLSGSQQEAKTWTEFALAVPGEADPVDRTIAEGVLDDGRARGAARPGARAGDHRASSTSGCVVIDDARAADRGARQGRAGAVRGRRRARRRRRRRSRILTRGCARSCALFLRRARPRTTARSRRWASTWPTAREQLTALGDSFALGMALFLESGRLMLIGDLDGGRARAGGGARGARRRSARTRIGGMIDLRIADVRMRRGDLDGAREFALPLTPRPRRRPRRPRVHPVDCRRGSSGSRGTSTRRTPCWPTRPARLDRGSGAACRSRARSRARERRRRRRSPPSAGTSRAPDGTWRRRTRRRVNTKDMPMLAAVAVSAAAVAAAEGDRDGGGRAARGGDGDPRHGRSHQPGDHPARAHAATAAHARGRARAARAAFASRAAPVGP